MIRELVIGGTTLLLTTQNLEEAEELAKQIAIIDRGRLIAEGTASELKERIAGSILEFRVQSGEQLERARDVTMDLFSGNQAVDLQLGRISGSVASSTDALAQLVRRLDASGINIADIHLRRPTLNEVFLALTGRESE